MEKKEKREKKLLTENRMATITKRETSFEGLVGQLENGEDGIYNLIKNDKNTIFQPKVCITKKDLEDIPELRQLRESIERWEKLQKKVSGRDAFIVKRSLIEMRKDQYIIKNYFKRPTVFASITRGSHFYPTLPWDEWVDENNNVCYSGLSFCDYKVVSIILQNFPSLKNNSWDALQGDTWYLVQDFEKLATRVLKKYPLYGRIVQYKLDLYSNMEIKDMLEQEFGFTHSIEYISSLWRNKIPKLIASEATDEWLIWYYSKRCHGEWKTCTRCGQTKLAHSRFFSINKTSRDGWYSICKACRNAKNRKEG